MRRENVVEERHGLHLEDEDKFVGQRIAGLREQQPSRQRNHAVVGAFKLVTALWVLSWAFMIPCALICTYDRMVSFCPFYASDFFLRDDGIDQLFQTTSQQE